MTLFEGCWTKSTQSAGYWKTFREVLPPPLSPLLPLLVVVVVMQLRQLLLLQQPKCHQLQRRQRLRRQLLQQEQQLQLQLQQHNNRCADAVAVKWVELV